MRVALLSDGVSWANLDTIEHFRLAFDGDKYSIIGTTTGKNTFIWKFDTQVEAIAFVESF